jgi:hypothetical protein
MSRASKAEIVENLLPTEVLHSAAQVFINENGHVVSVIDGLNGEDPKEKENTITLIYNLPLDRAIEFFSQVRNLYDFGVQAPRL